MQIEQIENEDDLLKRKAILLFVNLVQQIFNYVQSLRRLFIFLGFGFHYRELNF